MVMKMEVPLECGHNLDDKNIINLDITYHKHTNMLPIIESIPYLESQVEIKYEIPEYIDMKEIKEEPADCQQTQIKIENFVLDESSYDVPQEDNSSEDYSDNKNLDHSQIKCCEYEGDEDTDIKTQVVVIHNGDFEHSIYKNDQSWNSTSHMKTRILKTQTNKKHKLNNLQKIINYDDEDLSVSGSQNQISSEYIKKKKTYKCEHCHHEYDQLSNLKIHISYINIEEHVSYEITQQSTLKPHINSIHTIEKLHKCVYCDYGSHRMSDLKRHINSIHTRENIHKCEYCNYGSPQMSDLKRHINSMHTREKIHKCEYCDYGSTYTSNLKSHIKSMHTREEIHKCQYCDYGSPEKSTLKRHINSKHTREQIHKCEYCDYGSPRMSNLKSHINSIHTREKIHKCEYCDYGSPHMSALKYHVKCKHMEVRKEDN